MIKKKRDAKHYLSQMISASEDLYGDDKPSFLYYLLKPGFGYLLHPDADRVLSKNGIKFRRMINPIIKKVGARFLKNPQIFERRSVLTGNTEKYSTDEIELPDGPVIWMANHAFKDDVLATILSARRHAYFLFGSLPHFFNTFDGVTAWLNGVVLVNRKVVASRKTIITKALRVLSLNTDFIIFPEGVWNKTPNELILPLWPGIYRIARESGAKIVPVVHYNRDMSNELADNPIHTVIDDPIDISEMEEEEALVYLRDVMASWLYLMMERYGRSTREEEMKGFATSKEVWENHLCKRNRTVDRMDMAIETTGHYKPKWRRERANIIMTLSNIKNVTKENVCLVGQVVKQQNEEMQNDFQSRF